MFGMTNDQLMGIVRQVLPLFGGLAVTLGWLSPDKVAGLTQTILQIAGPLSVLVGVIWSLIANSKTSILTAAGNMPELAKPIELKDRELAASVPSPNVIAVVKP